MNMFIFCIVMEVWIRALQITNPSELDFAEVRRHCSKDQAGNLMLNFLQLPFKMHSSTSPTLTRPSRRSILPFTSHDLNSQSHTCKRKNCFQVWKIHGNSFFMFVLCYHKSPAQVYIAEFSISDFWIVVWHVSNFVNHPSNFSNHYHLLQGFSSQ